MVIYPTLTTKTCLRLVSYRLQWTQNGSVEGDFDNRALSLHHYHIRIYAYTVYIVRLMNLQCVQDRTDQRPVQMSYEIFQGGFKKTIKYKTQKKRRNQTKWKQQQQTKKYSSKLLHRRGICCIYANIRTNIRTNTSWFNKNRFLLKLRVEIHLHFHTHLA